MNQSAFVQVASSTGPFTISHELLREVKVRRNMEVVRSILRAIQEKPNLHTEQIKVEGIDDLTMTNRTKELR